MDRRAFLGGLGAAVLARDLIGRLVREAESTHVPTLEVSYPAGSVLWPEGINWAGGSAPRLTESDVHYKTFTFWYRDGRWTAGPD